MTDGAEMQWVWYASVWFESEHVITVKLQEERLGPPSEVTNEHAE